MAYQGTTAETWRSVDWQTPDTDLPPQAPEHPIATMQGAFEESMMETISDDPDGTAEMMAADSLTRRKRLLESKVYERTVAGRWKQKSGENFHPLWKLVAQISFGMHLLHKGMARSDDEVIRILQTHVDEIDGFLERTTEDLDLAQRDIEERIRYLKLPLQHGDVFDTMLGDRKFRNAIIEGNEKIEHIVDRTTTALSDTLKDVKKGFDGTRELARYFKRLDKTWERTTEEHAGVYAAMMGNTEGWSGAYLELQKKGNLLHESLVHLGGIIAEIQRRVGVASRKDIPTSANSRNSTKPNSRSHSPKSHRRHASTDSISFDKRRVSFTDKAKNMTGKLSLSHKSMSEKDKRAEQNMPKTACGPNIATPWDDSTTSVKETMKTSRGKRRSLSASTPQTPYDLESILRRGSNVEEPPPLPSAGLSSAGLPSAGLSSASSGTAFFMPPLKVSEAVYSPHSRRQLFPDESIKEEDEEDLQPPKLPSHVRNESVESSASDFQAEIVNASVHQARTRQVSVSGKTSPAGSFKPQLREVRSIDSLPSQTRGVAGLDSLLSSPQPQIASPDSFGNPRDQLKRSSSQYAQQPSLQNAVAILRRSSTFNSGGSNVSSPPSSYSRPPSELRPAPLNVPQSIHSTYRRPSSPTSVYTDNNYDNTTTGSRTPPPMASTARLDSVDEGTTPLSAPAARTSFLRSESSTETSTPAASPLLPPSAADQQKSTIPEKNKSLENVDEEQTGDTTPTQLHMPGTFQDDSPVKSQPSPQKEEEIPEVHREELTAPFHHIQMDKTEQMTAEPPLQSPREVAPERVPTPPGPRRMGSVSAPERIPSPAASPDLRALTSATVFGPEPDFPYGWEGGEDDDSIRRAGELDASPPAVELSARPPTADGEPITSGKASHENSTRVQPENEEEVDDDDSEYRITKRRSDTILRKEIEEQRKRDIAAAKRELEQLNRENEKKKAQQDIISRVAQQTGGGLGMGGANEEPVRDQRFPTGDTRILHKPPPVIIKTEVNDLPSPSRERPSGDQPRSSTSASPANVHATQSPSPPMNSLTATPIDDPLTSPRKARSPWRKVFSLGGDKDKQRSPSTPATPNYNREPSPPPMPKPEKEKKNSLGGFFKSHRKSRSSKDGRLALTSKGSSDDAGGKLSDGRLIRHGGGWNSGDIHVNGVPLVHNRHAAANQAQDSGTATPINGTLSPMMAGLPAGANGPPSGTFLPQGLPAGANGPRGSHEYLDMDRKEGTAPVPGVGTIDFGRASMQAQRESGEVNAGARSGSEEGQRF